MAALFPDELDAARRLVPSLAPAPARAPIVPQRAAAPAPKPPENAWKEGDALPADYVRVGTPGGYRNPLQYLVTDPFQRGMLDLGNLGDVVGNQLGLVPPEQLETNVRRRYLERQAFPESEADQAALKELSASPDAGAYFGQLLENPQLVPQMLSGMIPNMAPSIAGGLIGGLAGSTVGPVGTAVGVGTGTGMGTFATEFGNTVLATAMEDPRVAAGQMSLADAFSDAEIMGRARIDGLQRGIPVAIFDALTAGLAGKVGRVVEGVLPAGVGGRIAGAGAEATMQGAGGMAGEATGQLADTGQIGQLGNVLTEGLLEVAGTPIEVGINEAGRALPWNQARIAEEQAAREMTAPVTETTRQGFSEPWVDGQVLPDDYAPVAPPIVPDADLRVSGERQDPSFDPTVPPTPEQIAGAIPVELTPAPKGAAPEVLPPNTPSPVPSPAETGTEPTPAPVAQPPAPPAAVAPSPEQLPPEAVPPGDLEAPEQGQQQTQPGPAPGATVPQSVPPQGAVTPAPAPVEPASSLVGRGRRDGTFETERVWTPNGEQQIETRYEVIDAANLKAAEGQDQPRDREGRPMLAAHVRKIAATLELARAHRSPEIDRGAPLIDETNTVLSGNGRRAAVELAAAEHPDRYARYRQELEEAGYDTAGMQTPILVRRAMTPFDRRQLTVQGNVPATAQMSAAEQAVIDADRIDDDMLDNYDAENTLGVGAAANRDFIRRLRERFPETEQNALVTAEGELTPEGERRVENALIAKAYSDKRLVTALAENEESPALRKGLAGAAAAWGRMRARAPGWDITDALVQAINLFNEAKRKGITWEQIVDQHDIDRPLPPPEVVEAGEIMLDAGRKKFAGGDTIARRLREYADTAVDAETGTPDLMGEKRTPEGTRKGLAESARRRKGEAPAEPQPDLLPPQPVQPKPKKEAPQEKPPGADEGGLFADDLDDGLDAEIAGDFDGELRERTKQKVAGALGKVASQGPSVREAMRSRGAAVSEAVWEYIVAQGWVPGLTVDKAQNLPADQQMRLMARALKDKYGFKSVDLSSNEEGPIHPARALPQMRDAFRNLQVMAHSLGVPNIAMSLNGTISLAFVAGRRQSYWGVYYPAQKSLRVVDRSNTFAHEWGHALDAYLVGLLGKKPAKTSGMMAHFSLVNLARKEGLDPANSLEEAVVVLLRRIFYDHADDAPMVMEWEAQAAEVNTKGNPTPMAKVARLKLERWRTGKKLPKLPELDQSHFKESADVADPGETYFSTVHELMARSFEAFVATEMGGDKNSDRFISAGQDAFRSNADRQLRLGYPKDGEADAIYAAWREVIDYLRDEQTFGSDPADMPAAGLNDPNQYEKQVLDSAADPVVKAFIDEAKTAARIAKQALAGASEAAGNLTDPEDVRSLAADIGAKARVSAAEAGQSARSIADVATFLFATTRANIAPRIARARKHPKVRKDVKDSAAFLEKAATLLMSLPGQDVLQTPTLERQKNAIIRHVTKKLEAVLKATGTGLSLKQADADAIYQRMLGDQNVTLDERQEKLAVEFRRIMDDLYRQLQDNGHEFGYVRYGYLPRMLQKALVQADPAAFVDAAIKAYQRAFDAEIDGLDHRELVTRVAHLGHRLMDPQGRDQKEYLTEERKALAKARRALTAAIENDTDVESAQDAYDEARQNLIDAMRDDWAQLSAEDWRDMVLNGSGMTFHHRGVGAKVQKGRELPKGVEEDLADFLETNPLNLVIAYAAQTANALAFDKTVGNPMGNWRFDQLMGRRQVKEAIKNNPTRFNPQSVQGRINIIMNLTDPKVDNRYELLLRQALKDETTTSDDVDMFRQVYGNITGLDGKANASNLANRASNFLYAYGTLRLLSRSVTTALSEPMAFYLRTGNAAGMMATITSYIGQLARGSQSAQQTREWASSLELIASPLYDTFLYARLGAEGTLGSSQKILSKFMVGNWQTAITNAQLKSVGVGGVVWMRDMAQNVENATGQRKAYLAKQMAAELRELGIADGQQKEFVEFIKDRQQPPTPDEMATEMGQLLKHAIGKLSEQIIQHPSRADKPMAANTPFGKLAYQLTSFLYSFFSNIHAATWQRAKRNKKAAEEAGYTGMQAFGLAGAGAFNTFVLGFSGIFLAQLLTTTIREAIYNREQWDKHKKAKDQLQWLMSLAWSRTGALGPLDVLKSSVDGVRYERDLTTLVSGPALASILGDLKSIVTLYVRNAKGTQTTEANAAKAFYNLVIAPTIALGLASINTIGPISELGRFAALTYLTSNAAAKNFADIAGTDAADALS